MTAATKPVPTAASFLDKVTDETKALAAKLEGDIHIKDGKPTVPSDIYVKYLPDNLTVTMLQAAHDYTSTFLPAMALAAGNKVNAAFAADEGVKEMQLRVPMFEDDAMDLDFKRSKEYGIPKSTDKVTKFTQVTIGLETRAARGNRAGDMSNVLDYLSHAGMEAFGS